jgi:hypothetical protein
VSVFTKIGKHDENFILFRKSSQHALGSGKQ